MRSTSNNADYSPSEKATRTKCGGLLLRGAQAKRPVDGAHMQGDAKVIFPAFFDLAHSFRRGAPELRHARHIGVESSSDQIVAHFRSRGPSLGLPVFAASIDLEVGTHLFERFFVHHGCILVARSFSEQEGSVENAR